MAQVYLETSFISACVTDREDAASVYRREASVEWWESQRLRHTLVTSAEVFKELSDADFRHREQALAMISGLEFLDATEEVHGFASLLVAEFAMPNPASGGDALHYALAALYNIDFLLTWNVRHLANPNKLDHLRRLCMRVHRMAPAIVTPEFLWEAR